MQVPISRSFQSKERVRKRITRMYLLRSDEFADERIDGGENARHAE